MSEFVLSCCSTADMPLEFFQTRNVQLICFHYTLDGTEYADDLGQSIGFDTFYQRIADGAQPTTSQVNVQQYIEYFESFLKEGKDVLHIAFQAGFPAHTIPPALPAKRLKSSTPTIKFIWWTLLRRPRDTGFWSIRRRICVTAANLLRKLPIG